MTIMLPTPMMLPRMGKHPYWAVYDPDGVLIALFVGEYAEQNAWAFYRERCSDFCTVRDYQDLHDVYRVLPEVVS